MEPLPPDHISELLNDALPPGYKLIRARCGCGHLHNIISGKPLDNGEKQRISYKLLEKHHQEANRQNDELKSQLLLIREKLQNLSEENEGLHTALNEYRERNEFMEDHIRQLLEIKDAYDALIKEKDLLTVEATKGHVLLQQWKERCDELQMAKDAALTQVRQYREKIEELIASEKTQLEKRLQQESTDKEEHRLLKQKCDNLQAQYESTKKQLDETLKQQHEELNSLMNEVRVATSTPGNSLVQARMMTTPNPFASPSKSFASSHQRSKLWKKLREEIIALKQRNVVLAKQIMNVTKESQNNALQHEAEIKQIKEEADNLHMQIRTMQNNNAELAQLKQDHEKLSSDYEASKKSLQELNELCDDLKKTNSAHQSAINRLQNDKKQLIEQKEKLQSKGSIARLHERNDQKQLLQEIENLKDRLQSESSQFITMRNLLESEYKTRLKEMREQKEYLENRCQVLKQQVEILQRSEKNLQLQLKELRHSQLRRESNYTVSANDSNINPERPRSANRGRRTTSGSVTTTAPTTPSKMLSKRRQARKLEKLQSSSNNIQASDSEESPKKKLKVLKIVSPSTTLEPNGISPVNDTSEGSEVANDYESQVKEESDEEVVRENFVDTAPVPRKDEPVAENP